jgi:hypothetical protein
VYGFISCDGVGVASIIDVGDRVSGEGNCVGYSINYPEFGHLIDEGEDLRADEAPSYHGDCAALSGSGLEGVWVLVV